MDIISNSIASMSGLEQIRAFTTADIPPLINKTMNFRLTTFEEGRAVFEGNPDQSVYNPNGAVHGGYAATLLDSACGCAVHTTLPAGQGCTTLELKVAYHRPLTAASGPVRAEGNIVSIGRRTGFAEAKLTDRDGKLCATATSTLLIFPLDSSGSLPPAPRSN